MSWARALMLVRLVLGASLLRQGALGLLDLERQKEVLLTHTGWQALPLVGALRPFELGLATSTLEFALGIFLLGGLLTRLAALGATLLSLYSVLVFASLGPIATLAHAVLLAASALVLVKGGGAGTMDRLLGAMQRRSLEREAEREAAREAGRTVQDGGPERAASA